MRKKLEDSNGMMKIAVMVVLTIILIGLVVGLNAITKGTPGKLDTYVSVDVPLRGVKYPRDDDTIISPTWDDGEDGLGDATATLNEQRLTFKDDIYTTIERKPDLKVVLKSGSGEEIDSAVKESLFYTEDEYKTETFSELGPIPDGVDKIRVEIDLYFPNIDAYKTYSDYYEPLVVDVS